jgi:hypothetical protein
MAGIFSPRFRQDSYVQFFGVMIIALDLIVIDLIVIDLIVINCGGDASI